MAVRKIRCNDDEILRKPCKEVREVNDHICMLLADMEDTLHATENGAAIAACQVGILKRLVVIDMGEGVIRLINPRIVGTEGTQECVEGCLSFPGKFGRTVRPERVTVQALNEQGEEILMTGEGAMAKCFCHEIDHLDGIVFTDKVIEWLEL
ncbi:peptide deformylase [Anaerolentibacter hominis]|uniref:peptide deformylase n=1 Tax=Anaerolentibacter hominis TaxID=3079009 RepID=UPI0031B816CD